MPTTSNFGWNTPADTDLVKDGAAAIRTLGNNIDASLVDLKGGTTGQVLAKASNTDLDFNWVAQDDSNAIQNALLTTTGDTIYASSASTPARLGIGTNGQVLTVSGGVPAWVTPGGADFNWTLVNSGGTALTGATTVTVSGISGANQLLIYFDGASSASGSSFIALRFNADTGGNYNQYGISLIASTAWDQNALAFAQGPGNDRYRLARMGNTADSAVQAYALVTGCNTSGIKVVQASGTGNANTSSQQGYITGGFYSGTSAITSVSVVSSTGNFDQGTVYIYKA